MALIDHIRRCNRRSDTTFVPLLVAGQAVGRLGPEMKRRLAAEPLFERCGDGLSLSDRLTSPEARSDSLRPLAERLVRDGVAQKLRGEDYRVVADWGLPSLLVMDRALISSFGFRAFGIHVNGVTTRDGALALWIGKRAADKAVEPGKLDNMVAGGQPAGLTLRENLIKEAAEEAGLSEDLAGQARPVGAISYCLEEGLGLKRDTLFLYDLMMPADIIPEPRDGEMEGFALLSLPDLLDRLKNGFSFKFNVALVLIDFMIRHGAIAPETEPDYLALVSGLHHSVA